MPFTMRGSLSLFLLAALAGCASPEDGRARGAGDGADGGNYAADPVHAPSKLDGTRPAPGPSTP
jgi:hypothetical protein